MSEQTSFHLPTLYSYDTKGRVKQWSCWTEGSMIFVEHGLEDGKKQTKTTIASAKNIGKANFVPPEEQAKREAESKWKKQIDKNYHQDLSNYKPLRNPMLAYPYADKQHKVEWPCYAQPKLNGVRCLAYFEDGKLVFKSRGNKYYTTLEHLEEPVTRMLNSLPEGAALDGEIYIHGEIFETIVSAVKKLNPDTARLQYWVYDIDMPGDYNSRIEALNENTNDDDEEELVFTPTWVVASEFDLKRLHQRFVKEGYEGTMVKNHRGVYKTNHRSSDMLKLKDFDDAEFKITGYTLDKDGLIVFICECDNGNKEFEVVLEGGRERRRQALEEFDTRWLGNLLTVRFQNYSKNNIPIFPVGEGLREVDNQGNVL